MSWHYRIVKKHYPEFHDQDGQCDENCTRFGIHEAYCDKAGKVFAITEREVGICGANLEELKQDLEWHRQALDRPVLDYDDIPEEGAEHPHD